jgi:N6-L-threonylcarbamoyladenine synthase
VDGAALIADARKPLEVPPGGRGLRQSEALFQHVQNLPGLLESLGMKDRNIDAVAASVRPRPAEGSYMPVFTAGAGFARAVAVTLGVPFFETSHQEGHIAAGLFSLGREPSNPFLAFHISGGTTEILCAEPKAAGYDLKIVGSTKDLHAGQVIDRVGVALGLSFPAGPALEKLAAQYGGNGNPGMLPIKASVTGADCSLSGAESAAQRLIASGAEPAQVAFEVQRCLAGAFASMAIEASRQTGLKGLLVIGGVAANGYIRSSMKEMLGNEGIEVLFAKNPFSSDNAVGVAAIGQEYLRSSCRCGDIPL